MSSACINTDYAIGYVLENSGPLENSHITHIITEIIFEGREISYKTTPLSNIKADKQNFVSVSMGEARALLERLKRDDHEKRLSGVYHSGMRYDYLILRIKEVKKTSFRCVEIINSEKE